MSRRSRIGLAIAVVVALAAAGAVVLLQPWANPPRAFSYLTGTDLVVATADGVVARAPAVPATGGNATTTTWTSDGRFAVVVAEGPGGPNDTDHRSLVAVGVDGATGTRPCPRCTTVAAVGGSDVLASQAIVDPSSLAESAPPDGTLRFDLTTERPGVSRPFAVPDGASGRLFFVAGVPGEAYAVSEGARGREEVLAIRPDGSISSFGRHTGRAPRGTNQRGIGQGAIRIDPSGTQLAVSAQFRDSRSPGCRVTAEISLYRGGGDDSETTDLSEVVPPKHRLGVDVNVAALDLWWGGDGRLRTTLAVQPCGATDPDTAPTVGVWVLDGSRWSREGPPSALLADRSLEGTTRVQVRAIPDTGSSTGDTVVVRDGQETILDHGVQSYSVAVVPDTTTSSPMQTPPAGTPDAAPSVAEFAGVWSAHGVQITFDGSGVGKADFRTYTSCSMPEPGVACEPDGEPFDAGHGVVQLEAGADGGLQLRTVSSNDRVGWPVGQVQSATPARHGLLRLGSGDRAWGLCLPGVSDDLCGT